MFGMQVLRVVEKMRQDAKAIEQAEIKMKVEARQYGRNVQRGKRCTESVKFRKSRTSAIKTRIGENKG